MEPSFQILPPDRPVSPPPKRRGITGGLVAIGVLALKFGALALKSLKTSLSMLLMIWVYSWAFGWPFAIGVVLLIFAHEMGHVIAAKGLGIPVSAPLFIPFFGAYITMKENPRDAWTEALMAYGGPLAGGLGAWVCLLAAEYFHLPWLMGVASFTFVMNLFNLIPVPPLDGGRICSAVSPWFWIVGLFLLGAAVVFFHALSSIWIILLVLIMAYPRLKQTFFGPRTEDTQRYYTVSLGNRLFAACFYLGLIVALLLGYWDASSQLGYLWPQSPAIAY